MYRGCRTACDGDGRDRARIVDLLGNAEIKRQLLENAGPHPFRLPAGNGKGPPLRTADEEELHRGPALQGEIFRHRPRDRGTRRRLCHPVRVLHAGRADIEGASRFTHRRFRFATLHLGHETCDGYPPETVFAHPRGARRSDRSQVGERSIRFASSERAVLRINDHTSLRGVAAEAHVYRANGRTPIERLIDSYRIVRDRGSGIVNDLNGWFDAPEELVATIRRIMYINGQTARIVTALPKVVAGWATTAVRAVVPDGAQAAGHKMETWKCREIDPCPDNPAQKIFLFSRCPDHARIDERDAVMSGEYVQSLFRVD